MLRPSTLIWAAASLLVVVSGEDVRLLDIPPNEAQNLIEQQDLSLNYAPLVEQNVPAVRFLGKDQYEVVEDIYQAKQFHGQDGLGGYVYGYSVPDIAKSEKKTPDGYLKGSYSYVNGEGQEIKVEYYDDGTGFHQTDNLPDLRLAQVEDTPEVKAAKEEHLRLWNEIAAEHAKAHPGGVFPVSQDTYDPKEDEKYNRDYSETQKSETAYKPRKEDEEEEKGPPRGFFYSFDYPVGIVKETRGLFKSGQSQPQQPQQYQQQQPQQQPQQQQQQQQRLGQNYQQKRSIPTDPKEVQKMLFSGAAGQGQPYPNFFRTY